MLDHMVNIRISLEARRNTRNNKMISCLDCQTYVDTCQNAFTLQPSSILHQRDELDCEIDVCTQGPIHCRAGGQCERRICKDLGVRTSSLLSTETSDCKTCTSTWISCLHAACFPPMQDCYATSCPAVDPTCAAQCWSRTYTDCQAGMHCAYPMYSNAIRNMDTN